MWEPRTQRRGREIDVGTQITEKGVGDGDVGTQNTEKGVAEGGGGEGSRNPDTEKGWGNGCRNPDHREGRWGGGGREGCRNPAHKDGGGGKACEREYLIASQKGIKGANRGGPEGTRDTKNANKVYSPADRRERYVRTFRRHGNVFSAAMEINRP